MFRYYMDLALRSFRRNRVLTALMVLAIALGIGTSMTTLTVFYVLSGDPLPGRSSIVYQPQLDPRDMSGYTPGDEPPEQISRFDAEALLRAGRADRQALMASGNVAVEPEGNDLRAFYAPARYTSADFFPMFDTPFRYGRGWSAGEDDSHARVAVISPALNDKLFGGGNSVGKSLQLDQNEFRIVGVLDQWRPVPRFYDLTGDRFGELEQVFLPFSTSRDLRLTASGNMSCWGENVGADQYGPNAPCTWMQFWVELATPEQAARYRAYLENYAEQQRSAGRFERPTSVRLRNVMEWLEFKQVVPNDVRLQTWLAFGFLVVCLVNTVGLLLAKVLRRSGEIGVRRALGASRRAILTQFLVEAGVIGLAGGVLGLGLALLGLWAVRQQPASYAELANLDPLMLVTTFTLAIVAGLTAGLLPAWHACQVSPAMQLKSQ
jgi:putative ABC transport system permease protein